MTLAGSWSQPLRCGPDNLSPKGRMQPTRQEPPQRLGPQGQPGKWFAKHYCQTNSTRRTPFFSLDSRTVISRLLGPVPTISTQLTCLNCENEPIICGTVPTALTPHQGFEQCRVKNSSDNANKISDPGHDSTTRHECLPLISWLQEQTFSRLVYINSLYIKSTLERPTNAVLESKPQCLNTEEKYIVQPSN